MCPFPKSSSPAPTGSPPSEKAVCVLPYTICKNNSLIAVFIASHTKSVFNASNIVFPVKISPAIAAECVIPEHPIVSINASWIIPSFTFNVNLHAPCCGAHHPIPCVKPDMSLISFAFTHFPSSGIGAGPWSTPFATLHIPSNSFE